MNTTAGALLGSQSWRIELTSRVPLSVRLGDRISCEWQLTNSGATTIIASFYLRTTPARLTSLACPHGRIPRGRYHGSAPLHTPAGHTATITARVEPQTPGEHQLRVTVVTAS